MRPMWDKLPIDGVQGLWQSSFVQSGPFGLRHVSYYDAFSGAISSTPAAA